MCALESFGVVEHFIYLKCVDRTYRNLSKWIQSIFFALILEYAHFALKEFSANFHRFEWLRFTLRLDCVFFVLSFV